MIYGYCRVSSKSQLENNSFEQQENDILNHYSDAKIIKEQFTGMKTERPKFLEILKEIKTGDILVVTKLDRFARSLIQGSKIINELIEKGVKVNILNIGLLDNTPSSKLIRNIFFSFAEFERDMIVERTQEGKAIAKQHKDFKEGRPKKFGKKQIELALNLLNNHTYKQVEQMTGISKSTLIRAKKCN